MKLSRLLLATCLALTAPLYGAGKEVTLTSLEWPPYTGEKLPMQGASAEVARAAFAAVGYKLNIRFVPWSRAVEEAKYSAGVAGYFPEYFSAEVAQKFTLSDAMGHGPLGLAQRRDRPVKWATLADLSRKVVGTVQDYVNTPEFDERVARRLQMVDVAPDDTHNLLKLAAGRVDLAIVDAHVFGWLAENDPLLRPSAAKLEMNEKMLEYKDLYVCFRDNAEGKRLASLFNTGLKRIDIAAIMRKSIRNYE
ncbi:substrate-binding periplasmic protein [Chitinimonas sp.]|uniref:substrate-binding periplasmic protein n=1 Tax=Chitinimonas sp. TaxID=1934313 RepID=UPI0035B06D91